jgi:peptidoglycan/xylan/chitin deacetylase (PgdA/CDA1 family)
MPDACGPVPLMLLHSVSVPDPGARVPSLYMRPRKLDRYFSLLTKLGYRGVSMREALAPGAQSRRLVGLTFDDGYADNVESALPLLKKYQFTATCYVVSGSLGRLNEWDSSSLGVVRRMMTLEQLRAWHASGMEVGAHTRSHVHLRRCDDARARDEIAGSRKDLEQAIGAEVQQFAYPYGEVDDRIAGIVRDAGYVAATTTREARANTSDDRMRLPRINAGGTYPVAVVLLKLLTAAGDWRWLQIAPGSGPRVG